MNRRLGTYLNDHLAAAVAAVQLVRRVAGSNQGNQYGEALGQLATEIDEDRAALQSIMRALGIGEDLAKLAAAWGAEKLGRLKLNGQLTGYSPLSRLEELEMLVLGVEGKLLLWQTLSHLDHGRLAEIDFDRLLKRARSQRTRLRRYRSKAATEAF